MSEKQKKQHYIPDCYLKKFANQSDNDKENYFFFGFDKVKNRIFPTSTTDVCKEEDLYTVSNEYLDVIDCPCENKEKVFENEYFAHNEEKLFLSTLNNILLKVRNKQTLTDKDKGEFCWHIADLYLRHPRRKRIILESLKQSYEDTLRSVYMLNRNAKIDIDFDESIIHYEFGYGDDKLKKIVANVLFKHKWLFLSTNKPKVFYTSCDPISIEYHSNIPPSQLGITDRFTEILFPLAFDVILIMWDSQCSESNNFKDLTITNATDCDIVSCNMVTYANAQRFIYSISNNFDFKQK